MLEPRNPEMLQKKVDDAKKVIREAFDKYSIDDLAIAWTGGKDSTLVLWLAREVCREDGKKIPRCFNIDEGDMFDEIRAFIDDIGSQWKIDMEIIHNDDVSKAAGGKLGATVRVAELNERNQKEVERLGYEEDEFPYEPESFVGNHLMKTVTLNEYLERHGVAGFLEGIRWDEQASRANETYFSPREATDYS